MGSCLQSVIVVYCADVLLYVLKSCLSVCFCPLYCGFIEVMQCRIRVSTVTFSRDSSFSCFEKFQWHTKLWFLCEEASFNTLWSKVTSIRWYLLPCCHNRYTLGHSFCNSLLCGVKLVLRWHCWS